MARKFPIGIQTFSEIRNFNAIYVDKTNLVYKLAQEGKVYFLARPRRFGKSLLISTLDDYFSGRKELFTGLAIDGLETEWKKHPVLRFDFSRTKYLKQEMLDERIDKMLSEYEAIYGKNEKDIAVSARMESLILAAEKKTGEKVVFLVDEYDAPLLDTLVDHKAFEAMRQTLRDFYSPLKSLDAHLRFIFITGITKLSLHVIPASERESLFLGIPDQVGYDTGWAGLNHLSDISMLDEYATLCGISEEELRTQMKPEIEAMAAATGKTFEQVCGELKRKYDGYHFSAKSPDIYNPFSLMNSLQKKELTNYWFETGTPTFLIDWIRKFGIDPELLKNGIAASSEDFNVPTEGSESPVPVMYQSGYLTIKGYDETQFLPYTLAYPNEEVRDGFVRGLLKCYSGQESMAYNTTANTIINGFNSGDIDSVMNAIRAYLSAVPYDAAKRNELLYSTLIFGLLYLATPFLVHCEHKSAGGRADIVVETKSAIYVIELKMDGNGTAEDALKQIDDRGYLIPYTVKKMDDGMPKKLFKIGAVIDSVKRTLGEWKMAEA